MSAQVWIPVLSAIIAAAVAYASSHIAAMTKNYDRTLDGQGKIGEYRATWAAELRRALSSYFASISSMDATGSLDMNRADRLEALKLGYAIQLLLKNPAIETVNSGTSPVADKDRVYVDLNAEIEKMQKWLLDPRGKCDVSDALHLSRTILSSNWKAIRHDLRRASGGKP